jgi:acyl carrier protein
MQSRLENTSKRVVVLTEIWRQVLGNPDLNEDSSLFEHGGSSLQVLEIVSQIHDVLGADIKLRAVFSHVSPRSLSDFMEDEEKQ